MDAISVLTALGGGVLIGGAASGLLFLNGRIAGISGIVGGLLPPQRGEGFWRLAFVLGLLVGGVLLLRTYPAAFPTFQAPSLARLAAAGLLVGFGTGLSNGCTSGHGVCGLARRSLRSLVATITFMGTGALTVYVVNHVLRGNFR
ncbi:MAG TPA: YeeE/YedE thiosulfate transporter family protein [Candidatus Margulisiibacteriota bacterium]|nr:YeeE/YedE thiosulfate transporter family protein [Candidatus Margulisiibacteriota bacterium]